jgi:hypothetical protein
MNSLPNTSDTPPNQTITVTLPADWHKIEHQDPETFRARMQQFIDLRAQGLSLRKISVQLGVPKSTLYDWNIRNRTLFDHLRRVELEALEESLMGSRHDQITALSKTLKSLDKAFAHKLRDWEYDLSATELFWMAANLRQYLGRLYAQPALTDSTATQESPASPPL